MEHKCGRIARFEPNKQAEMFTLVLRGTQDVTWFANSNSGDYIVIDEQQLNDVLSGKNISTRQRTFNKNINLRF